jgi:hypothetical protein
VVVSDSSSGPYWETSGYMSLAFLDDQTGWFTYPFVSDPMGPRIVVPLSDELSNGFPGVVQTDDSSKSWHSYSFSPPHAMIANFPPDNTDCRIGAINTLPPSTIDFTFSCSSIATPASPTSVNAVNSFHCHSSDAGKTWTYWRNAGPVQFVNPFLGWQLFSTAPNAPGQLQKTTDGGQTWTTVQNVSWPNVRLDFIDEQTGWAIVTGPNNSYALVSTTDGGKTWTDMKAIIEP